jgi:hypothetical protein
LPDVGPWRWAPRSNQLSYAPKASQIIAEMHSFCKRIFENGYGFLKVSKSGIEWTRMNLMFVKFA